MCTYFGVVVAEINIIPHFYFFYNLGAMLQFCYIFDREYQSAKSIILHSKVECEWENYVN
jgi:hypothetical protein